MSSPGDSPPAIDRQAQLNLEVWSRRDFVKLYASRDLRPSEVILLARHARNFGGDVLELGCGAGRLTGYLVELARSTHAIDVSPKMVEHCRSAYPRGRFSVDDLSDLSGFGSESFDVIVGANNVVDVLGDAGRRGMLRDLARLLKHDGLLVFSSHNRAFIPRLRRPTDVRGARNALRAMGKVVLVPWREYNRRQVTHLSEVHEEYVLVNDDAHDFRLLHYYISRDAQERQLAEEGWQLVECLDREGRVVGAGQAAEEWAELYYVARRASA